MISSFSIHGVRPAGVTHCPPPAMQSGADEGPFVFIRACSELVKRYSSFYPPRLLPSLSVCLTHKMCTASARKKSILNQNICTRWHRTWSDKTYPVRCRCSLSADLPSVLQPVRQDLQRLKHWPWLWVLWSWQVCFSCLLIASSCLLTPKKRVHSCISQAWNRFWDPPKSFCFGSTFLWPKAEGFKIQASSFIW